MANEQQLAILKQGVDIWNKWREENPNTGIDLTNANLHGANLSEVNLVDANLKGADLSRAILPNASLGYAAFNIADLSEADLSEADLSGANLGGVDLNDANLIRVNLDKALLYNANLSGANIVDASLLDADLSEADLIGADLSKADLSGADLSKANLSAADLSNAFLLGVDFFEAILTRSNFTLVTVGDANFANLDLSKALELEKVKHKGPSTIGTDTIAKSKGKIPEVFLRGCGLTDWEIESAKLYNPELTNEEIVKIQYRIYDLRATQAIQINPLFISYSHADSAFVDKLETHLNIKGIRFWRDIHDAIAGPLEKQIDRAMRLNPTLILILSENSLKSDWVEHEVRKAWELGKEMGRDVLCPVALDNSWKSSPWPQRVMEQVMEYNILDFSAWNVLAEFENKFTKLIEGLHIFYKK